ncbi:metal ABC transporter solute-binding protein, Zn/Mn family [Jatrophihabitans sp.]|uniref:metal ABC transporter solute-binding protein, Zn/Mn family n=1 Tax=Jatrophihabitans sp. TaxID=1932789 RepID=UPI002C1716AC|nr:zinc ABC transporter substrate-binding protein [Jatrophihabitans sp.]
MPTSAAGRPVLAALLPVVLLLAGCATSPSVSRAASGGVIEVAASTSVWGSILSQLGGSHVRASSIISRPQTDPHAYEPTPADARTIARSRLFVENGVGYDPWAARTVAASPDKNRVVIDVGRLVGTGEGGNPHRWYSPADVSTVVAAISAGLAQADPADAGYFADRRRQFQSEGLAGYHRLISEIRDRFAGSRIGASESIVAPLAQALELDLITPAGLLRAVSEGSEPSAADKAASEAQLRGRQVAVYLYNSQNATPDVATQLAAARAAGVPVVAVTETVNPPGASFQQWQVSQLEALRAALEQAAR